MNEPLNIYEMLVLIRKYDTSPCGSITFTADYLNSLYSQGTLSSEDLWRALRDLLVSVITGQSYIYE